MTPNPNDYNTSFNGWEENRKFVLQSLENLNDKIDSFREEMHSKLDIFMAQNHADHEAVKAKISKHDVDIAMLNLKSGVWGAIGGLAVVLTSVLIVFLSRFIGL